MKRNKDTKRESETNEGENGMREIESLEDTRRLRYENEVLRRKRLELSPEYKKRVKEYFEQDNS